MISHSDLFDWMLQVGMGWIGWTEAQTLDTHMAAIALAYKGRCDMLKYIFGSGEKEQPEPEPVEPIGKDSILSILRIMNQSPPNQ